MRISVEFTSLEELRGFALEFLSSPPTARDEDAVRESVQTAADDVVFAPVDEDPEPPRPPTPATPPNGGEKRPRGRPRKDGLPAGSTKGTLPAPLAVAPETPRLPTPVAPANPAAAPSSRAEVVEALTVVSKAFGVAEARRIVEACGAKSVSDLSTGSYAAVITACSSRMAPPPQVGETLEGFLQ